jgi:hypothetical protein
MPREMPREISREKLNERENADQKGQMLFTPTSKPPISFAGMGVAKGQKEVDVDGQSANHLSKFCRLLFRIF